MKNKQTGCAYLETTTNGKPFKGTTYSGLTDGFPNLKVSANVKLKEDGPISSMVISKLSQKGGSGTATLKESNGKLYTSGSITLIGREEIKDVEQIERLMRGPTRQY